MNISLKRSATFWRAGERKLPFLKALSVPTQPPRRRTRRRSREFAVELFDAIASSMCSRRTNRWLTARTERKRLPIHLRGGIIANGCGLEVGCAEEVEACSLAETANDHEAWVGAGPARPSRRCLRRREDLGKTKGLHPSKVLCLAANTGDCAWLVMTDSASHERVLYMDSSLSESMQKRPRSVSMLSSSCRRLCTSLL